ncbi:ankyrin domain protein [Seiridium cupressi]
MDSRALDDVTCMDGTSMMDNRVTVLASHNNAGQASRQLPPEERGDTPYSKWYTPGSDFCYYATAQEASRKSRTRLSKLKLTPEERQLLLTPPTNEDGVVNRLQLILSQHEKQDQKSQWRERTGKFFVGFSKVVTQTASLVGTLLPQSPEYSITFGLLVLLFKLLDESLIYYRSGRLANHSNGAGKLVDAVLQPMDSKFDGYIARIDAEVKKMDDLKNIAHEAQAMDIHETVTNTSKVVSDLYEDFHKVSITLGFGMEALNERLLGVESRIDKMRVHDMVRYAHVLQNALIAPHESYIDAQDVLSSLVIRGFRLSQRDHWENNGVLEDLIKWSRSPEHSPLLWIGGRSGSQDPWVTELSLDIVKALLPHITVIHVFCSELARTPDFPTPRDVVKALVAQLLEIHPELVYDDAVYYNERRFKNTSSFRAVWHIFENLMASLSDVFVVIDRIEECYADDDDAGLRNDLLPSLTSLLRSSRRARAIVTSTLYPPQELMDETGETSINGIYINTKRRGMLGIE